MIDLSKHPTLIEASAGTGKTYTLCRIALQLTLQKRITLDRILAVTFTEAATDELAGRIHQLYQQCLRELEIGKPEEPLLLQCMQLPDFDLDSAKSDLRFSLEVFDEAPISTIHSFCKRCLDRVVLETEFPIDAELTQIEDVLVENLQAEYVRTQILETSTALSLAVEAEGKAFKEKLSKIGKETGNHPDAKLKPEARDFSPDELEKTYAQLPSALRALLEKRGEYTSHLAANRKVTKLLSEGAPELAACFQRGYLLAADFSWLEEFRSTKWASAMKKTGANLPTPEVCALVDRFCEQKEAALLSLLFNYRSWLSKNIEQAKQRANVVSYNDLLHSLKRALRGEAGEQARQLLARDFDAALIDEFQDTDRTQLEIVNALFATGQHYLFYIGDPKQAIYRFRGADIYAYLKATQKEGLPRIPLKENYRSTPRLVAAVNLFFKSARAGFVDTRIPFTPVTAGLDARECDADRPAFVAKQLIADTPGARTKKAQCRRLLAERAASDLARRINEEPDFDAGAVAFLTHTKKEAQLLQDTLLRHGIPAAILAEQSIFATEEARAIQELLSSLASPTRVSLKRAAYAAIDGDLRASEMTTDGFEEAASPIFEYLSDWSRDWFARDFGASLQTLLERVNASKVMDFDSERRFANFCQLGELLAEARDCEALSPRGLHRWLMRKANANVSRNEEWQTRISSDAGKPLILTVHKSKGLQFKHVILPFVGLLRLKEKNKSEPLAYHGDDDELIFEYAPEANSPNLERANREELAENARLLYVALTRAEQENLLYLCPEEMGKKNTPSSSLAQLLLNEGSQSSSEDIAERLREMAAESAGAMSFVQEPLVETQLARCLNSAKAAASVSVQQRVLENRLRMPFPERVLSFSALNRSFHAVEATSLLEELETEVEEVEATEPEEETPLDERSGELSIFTLPKGTHAGDLLHLILERYDFSRPDTLAATTKAAFESLQFKPVDYEPIVAAQIDAIAKLPLRSSFAEFTLQKSRSEQRIAELEFAYRVDGDVRRSLLQVLQTADLGSIPLEWKQTLSQADSPLSASMLRGFIDLVLEHEGRFYLFDWKSNYLGPSPSDYNQAAIAASMTEHNYYLQYLLYALALKRYAAWRYPEVSFDDVFGGVFYIYARGVSPGQQTGVYYDKPATSLLEALDGALRGGDHA